jgi:outer membrane protein OmpA-like peptidoglycan-associated protein
VLLSGGVIRERLIATGFGETRPVADNSSDDGRARNRRVEVYVSAFTG